ncbi:MAG: hypothetical protein ACRCX2_31955 [Paraclostridium sp.]
MKNKIKDFLIAFNGELKNTNRYCNLQFFDDGFVQGISFPEIHLFDDDNDSTEYTEQLSLSRLVKTLNEVLKITEQKLSYKVDEFFTEKKKEVKEKFPNAKIDFIKHNNLEYYTLVYANYYEDMTVLFLDLDVIKQDFEYVFEGLKLDVSI